MYTNQKKLAERIKEQLSECLQETHFKYNDIGNLKIKCMGKITHTNINQGKA